MKNFIFLFLVFSLVSCTCSKRDALLSPEEVVRAFVQLSATADSQADKDKLKMLCIGEMRRAFEKMNEDAFRMGYLKNHIRIKEFKVMDKSQDNSQSVHVSYRVTVENQEGSDPTQETNEREVDLILTDGAWYIESIKTKGSDQVAFTRGMIF